MTVPLVEVQLGGLSVRVPGFGSRDETLALVDLVNGRLKELESRSSKVNTQAFALRAAYEFAVEAAELQQAVKAAEDRLVEVIQEAQRRVEAFRDHIEEAAHTGKD